MSHNNDIHDSENRASKLIAIRTQTGITCSPSTSQQHRRQQPMTPVASAIVHYRRQHICPQHRHLH